MDARCAVHSESAAAGTCARCGAFFCEADRRTIGTQVFCAACAARPEVNYLEQFRLKYWGKRDGWAWLWGIGSLVNVLLAGSELINGDIAFAMLGLGLSGCGICYFLGFPWARNFVFLSPLAAMAFSLLLSAPAKGDLAFGAGSAVGAAVVPLLVAFAIRGDTRNQLFFKVHPSPQKLQKAWNLYANNVVARHGFMLSLLGLMVPGVSLLGLGLSIRGLLQVDSEARPPIGRKGRAIAGIVLGALGTLGWGLALVVPRLAAH